METGDHDHDDERGQHMKKPNLSRRNNGSSFRLRSPSLNSVRLRRIFDIFDRNNDSMISVDELHRAVNRLGLDIDASELDDMVKTYVQPGNDGLRFEDFEALHHSLTKAFFDDDDAVSNNNIDGGGDHLVDEADALQDESDLKEAFKVFDEDGDGYISATELQIVLDKLGFQEGREIQRVEMMISSVDRNHDGLVDFSEFKDMMRTVLVPTA